MKPRVRQAKTLHLLDGGDPLPLQMSPALVPRQAERAELNADVREIKARIAANPATMSDVVRGIGMRIEQGHDRLSNFAGGIPYGIAQALTPAGVPAAGVEANQAYQRGDTPGVVRAVAGGVPLLKPVLGLAQQALTSDVVANTLSPEAAKKRRAASALREQRPSLF